MESTKPITNHRKIIRPTCFIANIVYLSLHVFYLILFLVAQLPLLAYIDIGFIVVYILTFLLLKYHKYYLFALTCGNAFLAFIIVNTIYIGFDTGFHLVIIGLAVVAFFTAYFNKVRGVKNPLIWASLSITVYFIIYFVTKFNQPVFTIPSWLEMILMTTHIIFTFLLLVGYLVVFLKYAFYLEGRIMNESRTDELTQINNRYALYDYLETINDKTGCVLAIYDIDDFKIVNDTYGHVCGDYVLKTIAEISSETIKEDFTCRYGGEEFIIIFRCCQENPVIFKKLEQLRKNIESYNFVFENQPIKITITLGGAKYMKQYNTLNKWIEQADAKLYEGKHSGKNKTVIE